MKRRLVWAAVVVSGIVASGPGAGADNLADLVRKSEAAYYDADFRTAGDWAGQALILGLNTLPPDDIALLDVYGLLAASAEKEGDLDVAEQRYADLVAVLERHTGGPDSLNTGFGLDPLAHILLRKGRVDEAEGLFLRAIANRRIAIVDGNDVFAARHDANLAAVASARGQWDDALEGFDRAIQAIAAGDAAEFGNDDSLVDTRSPTNSWTFVGLAEAAWRLKDEGRHDPAALADRAFRAMQWKWRTSAAAALFEASLRAYADDPEKDRRQREIREIELALASTEEQLAALHEAEAAALSETEAFQEFMDRGGPAAQEEAIAGVNDTLQIGAQMLELYESCNRLPPEQLAQCSLDILPQVEALQAQMMPDQETIDRLYAPLSPEEQEIEDRFGPERVRLYEESGRLQEALRQAEAAFERDFGSPAGEEGGFLVEPDPIGLADAQALVGDDAALVAFLVGDDGVFAWALTSTDWQWAPLALDGRRLRTEVADLRRSLGAAAGRGALPERADLAPSPTGFDLDKAHALYQALLGPFESLIGDKPNLLVVPSGPLASLPFHALVTEPPPRSATGPDAYRQAAWLVRKHAVTVLPSVVSLRALDQFSATGGADLPFIGFGDPVFDGGAPDGQPAARGFGAFFAGKAVDTDALRQLDPLPESADELRAVAASLGASDGVVILGGDATEAAVKAAPLDRYRVVHFATHGLVAGELRGLAEPGLVLTPPLRGSPADDGLLTAGEVLRLNMNADWVVLSACNTAAGSTEVDEPLSGLARAFFYAGARAMLVSHWPVYSDAAVLLTTRAFAEMASDSRIGRSEALRRAMVAMIDGPDSRGADPVRWAPFSLIGKGW